MASNNSSFINLRRATSSFYYFTKTDPSLVGPRACETEEDERLFIPYGGHSVQPTHFVIISSLTERVNVYSRDLIMAIVVIVLKLTLLYSTFIQQLTVFDWVSPSYK